MISNLGKRINEILNKILICFDENKGVIFDIKNGKKIFRIYIKFDINSIPHFLGINRLKFFQQKKEFRDLKNIINYLKQNILTNKQVKMNKKGDISVITCKLDALNVIFDFFNSNKELNNNFSIKISKSGSFLTHKYDFIISINEQCLVLKRHQFKLKLDSQNFNSTYILSIRNLNCFKKENSKIVFEKSCKVIKFKKCQK
ncbi:MAG: hypothetical protein K2I49_03460 [Ureaplasma sp.]|nr:hypothetical protein [Ureaplasma sp.]